MAIILAQIAKIYKFFEFSMFPNEKAREKTAKISIPMIYGSIPRAFSRQPSSWQVKNYTASTIDSDPATYFSNIAPYIYKNKVPNANHLIALFVCINVMLPISSFFLI